MAKKLRVTDYTKYFIPTSDGVLVDSEIFKRRTHLGEKVWDLLKLMSGVGTSEDIAEFEHVVDDLYLARKEFDAIRDLLFNALVKCDGEFCKQCGSRDDLTVDHIIALSRGGSNDLSNLQILCRTHNSSKGAR